jgi:polynucleotide 5'-kinase involved in rRNA processing
MKSSFDDLYDPTLADQDILDKLEPAKLDPSRRTECLANTRKDVLKFVIDWVNDTRSEQRMLWIHGLAGSGKSTLTTTIAIYLGIPGSWELFCSLTAMSLKEVTLQRSSGHWHIS